MKHKVPLLALTGVLLLVSIVLAGSAVPTAQAQTSVFVNELHYDNTGDDVGEAVEIAGPAGTDLSGWSIALYNGSASVLNVYDTINLSGVIPEQQDGCGTLSFLKSGIQNGTPDGLALVDSDGSVVQFLSYEGDFTAAGGPAAGMTSTDIGVSESSSTPIGDSLQLTGTGSSDSDFAWIAPSNDSFGEVNSGQTFSGCTPVEPPVATDPVINEFVADHIGTDTEAFIEILGDPSTDYSAFTLLEIEGDGGGAGVIDAVLQLGTTNSEGYWTDDEDMENGTITILLVEGFSGSSGTDLDTNNDGVFDLTPWSRIVDDVATNEGGTPYSTTALAAFFDGISFDVGGASRIPNGVDTDTTDDWVRNDYHGYGFPGFSGSPAIGEAENTPGAVNAVITVETDPDGVCGDPATLIHDIQGAGLVSDDVGNIREVEAVVVGDFQDDGLGEHGDLNGFHIQEETDDHDGDPLTSEGIFVYAPDLPVDVAVGDLVRVRGEVAEYVTSGGASSQTQLRLSDLEICTAAFGELEPTSVTLPLTAVSDFERYEGMSVIFLQDLAITEYYNFDRYNEVVLATDRQFQPTAIYEPGSQDAADLADLNARSRITLDDGRTWQNPYPAIHPDGAVFDLSHLFRGGDLVSGTTGVIDENFGLYRIQPTTHGFYTAVNPRPPAPGALGGEIEAAALNVLNYFLTLDAGSNQCGPPGYEDDCRGANTAEELARQRAKIVAALADMDSDVVGLIELENDEGAAIADLVDGLNDTLGAGTYAYIDTGYVGFDVIKVGFIYKPATVTPVGDFAVLDSEEFLDPNETGEHRNRAALAQTFKQNSDEALFTAVVNHFKSKGTPCEVPGDDDPEQGSCNVTRTMTAQILADWLATDPTGSKDPDFMILGDLNSYDKEDPIDVLVANDYTDLVGLYGVENAYSYVFSGQFGYLDYVMANTALLPQVTDTVVWNINSDEPDILDYDMSYKHPQTAAELYEPNAYRASDHDPVIVGLDLNGPPVCDAVFPSTGELWPANHKLVPVSILGLADPDGDDIAVTITGIRQDEPVIGRGSGKTSPDGAGVGTNTAELRAERDGGGNGRAYHVYFTADDGNSNSCTGEVVVFVPKSQGNNGAAVDDGPLYDSTQP